MRTVWDFRKFRLIRSPKIKSKHKDQGSFLLIMTQTRFLFRTFPTFGANYSPFLVRTYEFSKLCSKSIDYA